MDNSTHYCPYCKTDTEDAPIKIGPDKRLYEWCSRCREYIRPPRTDPRLGVAAALGAILLLWAVVYTLT